MAALEADIVTPRYGTPDGHQPLARGLTAGESVFRGSVAVQANTGYLVQGDSPATTDLVLGLIANAINAPNTGPGITSPSSDDDGDVVVEIETGTFILASGTGSDTLDVATNGATVYLIDEKTVGKTNGGSSRPVAGVQMASPTEDPSIPTGYVAVKLGTPASPLGGP